MTDNLFTNKDNPGDKEDKTNQGDTNNSLETMLMNIKNDDGSPKYKTTEEAIKALGFSQDYIKTLEAESKAKEDRIKSLEEKTNNSETVEQIVDRILASKNNQNNPSPKTTQDGNVSEEAISNIVQKYIEKNKEEQNKISNTETVIEALKTKYGDKAKEVINNKAKELNMTTEQIGDLSSTNPKLVLSLFNTNVTSSVLTSNSDITLPIVPIVNNTLPKPTKSLMRGASEKDQVAFFTQLKAKVNENLGVEN